MKTTNKNNPVLVGALLSILVITLFFLQQQMRGGNAPAVTLTSVADTPADSAPKTTGTVAPRSDPRDPFDHPALHRAAKADRSGQAVTTEAPSGQAIAPSTPAGSKIAVPSVNGQTAPFAPISPGQSQVHSAIPMGAMPISTVPNSSNPTVSSAKAPVQEADDPLKGWRLTAIIAGHPPRAIIEGVGTGVYRVGVGERIRSLRVTAIQEREIVLCDAHHLYTLPLTAAPPTMEINKDDSSETSRNTTPEIANGTPKIQP